MIVLCGGGIVGACAVFLVGGPAKASIIAQMSQIGVSRTIKIRARTQFLRKVRAAPFKTPITTTIAMTPATRTTTWLFSTE